MKKFIITLIAVAAVVGLVFAYIAGQKEVAAEATADQPLKAVSRVEVVNGETVVTLDQATRTSSGIVLAPLQNLSHRAEITAHGTVVELGELTDLRNALAAANAQFAKANAAFTVARQEHERMKGLFEANQNVSEKTVQAAEGALRIEEANLQAAQAALEAARSTAQQRWGRVVADWLAQGGPEIERLRRQDDLLVQVTLAPSQSAMVAPPQASVQMADGQLVAAKLVSSAPRTDPKLQGRSFFYLVATEGAGLLPGMNVVMLLAVGEPAPSVLVPASSAVWFQGKPWIYVQIKPDRFARREISTAQPVKEGWVQPADFSHNEPIVAHGAQLLLSEEFRAQISISN